MDHEELTTSRHRHGDQFREVTTADALPWLEARPLLPGCSFVTSLPDFSEFPSLSLEEWKEWFRRAAGLVLRSCPDTGVAIFYQTDIKVDGTWVDKAFLIQQAAEASGHALLWHKLVCKAPAGQATFGRPGYSHLLCFSRELRVPVGASTADVLPQAGEVTWTRGMGVEACRVACRFILEQTSTRTVVDPFCGHGTVLAVANSVGLDAVGVELGGKRARKARALRLTAEGTLVLGE
jgi:hypothetical protein